MFARRKPVAAAYGAPTDGIVAVDAMVALVILATTLSLSLNAAASARRAALAALETRQAIGLLRGLFDDSTGSVGVSTGLTDRFAWTVAVAPAPGSYTPPIEVCERVVAARSMASGRTYSLKGAGLCSPRTQL